MKRFELDCRPWSRATVLTLAVAALGVAGCDFLDPTEVENPRTTDEDLANAAEPTKALLPGLRAQFARLIGATASTTENVSDNYSIHGTGIFKEMDDPRAITPTVANSTGEGSAMSAYWHTQELRALTDFVIDVIAPEDATATNEQVAEALYYRGMAELLMSENFSLAPREEDGAPVPAAQHLDFAIQDLNASISQSGSGDFAIRARAALARAHRWKGGAEAEQFATQVLSEDPGFLFQQEYDATSIENNPYAFLFLRALQEMQPLPRLDFLDPKYLSREAGIAVGKAEEMHLILAEAALARGAIGNGRGHLVDAINAARARGATSFVDNDPRLNADLSIRPRDDAIRVRADAQSPFRSGLVLTRADAGGNFIPIPIPPVSATSLDPDSVQALTDPDDVWHAFYLARQEILVLEGRRMADLGIKLPMMLREIDANPNISDGDPGTRSVVPSYIPQGDEMDLFDPASPYDANENLVTDQVTIRVDMNRVLVQNRVTPFN